MSVHQQPPLASGDATSLAAVFCVGSLRVDPRLDEIYQDGVVTKLEPRTMRLLVCLAEHAGGILSVEQLLDAVWKDVVVGPDSVYQAVAGLRRILRDDPKNPTYIANVVRRGYRLVAPVTAWVEPLPADAAAVIAPPVPGGDEPVVAGSSTPLPVGGPVVDAPFVDRRRAPGPLPRRRMAAVLWVSLLLLGGALGVYGFTMLQHRRVVAAGAPVTSIVVQDKSVAVLPFVDISEKKDQQYFADGLTEEIIDRLARVPGLRVPARTSSFYFKGKSTKVRDIAKELGVAHVLEGSVRIMGRQLRVAAQLVRADNGYQIWSNTYNLSTTDLFDIQDDIAASVVQNLKATLLPATPRGAYKIWDPEAVKAVTQARFLIDRAGNADNREAIAMLERALEIEPQYALAWAELATAHRYRASFFDESPDQGIALARAEALKALAIDPNCAEAHDALADVKLFYDFDPAGAARENEAIQALDPSRRIRTANPFYSGCVVGACYEQVLRDAEEQIARDPLNPSPYSTRALAHYVYGDLEDAERDIRRAIDLGPDVGYRHYMLVRILIARRDYPHLVDATTGIAESLYSRAARSLAFHALGKHLEADRSLQELVAHDAFEGPYQIAEVYAARDDLEQAMNWLEKAYVAHDGGLWTLQVDPLFKPLATNARFLALKAKLKM